MNETQYMVWILDILDQYQILYPDIYNNYYFHKIIYWKLEMSHNVTIVKNNNFLNNIIPILYKTWDQVLYYRKNISELDILNTIVAKRKKYFKFNISYKIHNNLILKKNIKFLDNNVNKKIILNSNDLESDDDNI